MTHRFRLLAAYLLAIALLLAAWSKVSDPSAWYYNLLHYRILPEPIARAFTWLVPSLEVVVALSLFLPAWRPSARLWCLVMGVLFVAFISSAWARGLDITCGCFGGQTPVGPLPLARAFVFFGLSLLIPTATASGARSR